MDGSARSVAALAALVSGALISIAPAGCAHSDPADTTPGIDPTLPDIDAAWAGDPAAGPVAASDAGAPATGPDAEDAGPTPPDAGHPTPPRDAGCDAARGPSKPSPGELLISEVMYNPIGSEPGGEWLEVVSRATGPRSLSGLTLVDAAGRTHVIGAGVVLDAGAYALLVRSIATATSLKVPAAAILYEYGTGVPDNAGVLLSNSANGKISIVNGQTVLAQVPYGGWFTQTGGSSVQLGSLDYATSTAQASWCLSQTPWTTGSDKGTPGGPSDCP
jgi:hypothetical protein